MPQRALHAEMRGTSGALDGQGHIQRVRSSLRQAPPAVGALQRGRRLPGALQHAQRERGAESGSLAHVALRPAGGRLHDTLSAFDDCFCMRVCAAWTDAKDGRGLAMGVAGTSCFRRRGACVCSSVVCSSCALLRLVRRPSCTSMGCRSDPKG